MDAVRNILRERQILESIDHAFVVNMRFAFQDDEYMYMCMDLMMGGDLRFHMNRRNFDEDVIRFWIAEISSAIAYLHSLGIIHRDIKPDNVLLDEKGHAHLTDFNIGCRLMPEKPLLTSQSGTVAYMAPEVFKGTGYGTSVDWWALGIVFYECLYNQRPFLTENVPDLKLAISTQTVEYPTSKNVSQECISVIQGVRNALVLYSVWSMLSISRLSVLTSSSSSAIPQFLTRDPSERLGTKGGMNGIRSQPYFAVAALQLQMPTDQWWYMLETKQLSPKFQPPSEAANFDATYDLEEMLLDEDPLTYHSTRKRAQRMQRQRDQALKEESERLKAEQDAAMAAAANAQAAMEAMNRQLEESIRRKQASTARSISSRPVSLDSAASVISKKKSRLQFFGGGNNDSSGDGQPAIQTQSPLALVSQPQHPSHQTPSQISRQTQFQSIPLSPIDAPGGAKDFPMTSTPSFRLPLSPPDFQNFQSSIFQAQTSSAAGPQAGDSPDHHPSSYYHRGPVPPKAVTSATTAQDATVSVCSTGTAAFDGQEPAVTEICLSKSADSSHNQQKEQKREGLGELGPSLISTPGAQSSLDLVRDSIVNPRPSQESIIQEPNMLPRQQQYPFQAAHPQIAVSSPVIIPTPLDHSISRHKQIPTQQPLPLRHQNPQQQPLKISGAPGGVGVRPRGSAAPAQAATINIAAAAAAMADMSEMGKVAYLMDLIDREFTTFDYTVYESYNGLVDPVTMSVGNPPEWVRSRD
ncbi:hypothetical protein BGZ99_008245 [Dissophora globulifera]|uniref:Protein kinase domain-containing protein n=1 Tax=Dissophora globulifera TaxID=979702 RepID=A0A9P6RRB3_9FUNG|nr:hypothetical protein BGZ99_008245 [Dissophora globulifera]